MNIIYIIFAKIAMKSLAENFAEIVYLTSFVTFGYFTLVENGKLYSHIKDFSNHTNHSFDNFKCCDQISYHSFHLNK